MMKKTDMARLGKEDAIDLIGRQWMLVTAGTPQHFNTMTASWGGIGFLWGKPVVYVFIRPERYTHDFVEAQDRFTLSFFPEDCRQALALCGKKSGRDCNKVEEAGLSPVVLDNDTVGFAESRLSLVCRKLYKGHFEADRFIDKSQHDRWYNDRPGGGLHDVYVAEIEGIYES